MTPETISTTAQTIFQANADKGFWDVPEWAKQTGGTAAAQEYIDLMKSQKLALIHSELSEALEGLRKHAKSDKIPDFTAEEEELADALIRILDYAGGFGLQLGEAFAAKLEYNRTRPHKHGKRF